MSNHAVRNAPDVPRELTASTWGALCDLAAVGLSPAPRVAAKLLELGLIMQTGERRLYLRRGTVRVVAVWELTAEGARVVRRAPAVFTGREGSGGSK